MSSATLTKREHIALEILKILLAHKDQAAIDDAFQLADEFLAVSQTYDKQRQDTANTLSNNTDSQNSQSSVAVKIFNHDHPKTAKESS